MGKGKRKREQRDPEFLLNWLVAGGPGSGKTTAVSHFAHLGRVLHCDTESGIKKRPLAALGVPVENISIRPIRELADLDAVYYEAHELLADDPFAIAGINLDTTTEMIASFLEEVLGESRKKYHKAGMEWDDEAGRDEYRIVTQRLRRITRRLRDLPCHVAWTCHLKRETDDDGKVIYTPALTPSYSNALQGFVDVITTHTDFNDGYVAVCKPAGKYRAAKDRIGFLPPVLAQPTADRVVALLEGTLNLAKDPHQLAYLKAVGKKPKNKDK